MKTILRQLLQSVLFGLLLPGFLFSTVDKSPPDTAPSQNNPAVSTSTVSPSTAPTQSAVPTKPMSIAVLQKDGNVQQMDLEDYVCAVVLGEMPASFEVEALKAQAVAARTYALRCAADGCHKENAVCMEHTCCQNYCDPEKYVPSGGKQSNLDKVRNAVEDTRGLVAVYNGKPIFAAYFASSGGSTEDAAEVWGRSFPYLKSVASPNEADRTYQNYKLTMTAASFQKKLGGKLTGDPEDWLGKITYTAGGGVKTVEIGGRIYTGVKLRSLLGLRSTCFTVCVSNDSIMFMTNGYGHRVGMSQYGAEAMAIGGADYVEILQHYYTGVQIQHANFDGND